MATVFLLALVSQTSSESQSGGNTHTHTHGHIHTHLLKEKPNKDSYKHRDRGGEHRGGNEVGNLLESGKKIRK